MLAGEGRTLAGGSRTLAGEGHMLAVLMVLACLCWVSCASSSQSPPASGSLHEAAWRGDAKAVRAALVRAPTDTAMKGPLGVAPPRRSGPGSPEALANARAPGNDWTPLHLAAMAGHADVAALLLDMGADPNARARYDLTPLHWAAIKGQAKVAELLLRRGALATARDIYGATPLHLTADEQVARVLFAGGATHDIGDDLGMTPLHTARTERVARVLLKQGASPIRRNRAGKTPMEITVWEELERHGIMAFAEGRSARLRGATASTVLRLRNVRERALEGVMLSAESPACTTRVVPAFVPRLEPGQLVVLTIMLFRREDVPGGEYPMTLLVRAHDKLLDKVKFFVDTRREETPEDRGEIRVASALIARTPPRWHALAYVAGPLAVLLVWLLLRRRR